jgi:peroxiredoxin
MFCAQGVAAQTTIELNFPKLSGDTAWIYSFAGSRVDSFSVVLNKQGKAKVAFPKKDYRGMAYFYIPEKGGGEFVIAEPKVQIICPNEQFNGGMLQFPQSAENTFLRYIFQRRDYLLGQQEWLKAGEMYVEQDFKDLKEINAKSLLALDDSVRVSPLYAARLMELTQFMQRLYGSVRTPADTAGQHAIWHEIEQKLDINALYTSGNLWTDVHTYYPGVFVGFNLDSVQAVYAASVGKTMSRLKEPVLTAFLSSAVSICERSNRPVAEQILLRDFLMAYPNLPISDPKIKRMFDSYSLNKGSNAPVLFGLEKPLTQPAILIFFDSNCDHCHHELDWLTAHYSELVEKGYRIVSIAADTEVNNYRQAAAAFVWDKSDRLCDFKGFYGENFVNYQVKGTPTIFVTDGEGKIAGRFAKLAEAWGVLEKNKK